MLLGHESTLLSWQPHQSGWTPDLSLKLQPLSDFGYAKKKKVSSAAQALLHVFIFKILRIAESATQIPASSNRLLMKYTKLKTLAQQTPMANDNGTAIYSTCVLTGHRY